MQTGVVCSRSPYQWLRTFKLSGEIIVRILGTIGSKFVSGARISAAAWKLTGHFSQKLSVKCRQELFAREAHISCCERSNFQGKLSSGFWVPSGQSLLVARAWAPQHEKCWGIFLKNGLANPDRSFLLVKPTSVAANVQTFRGNYPPDFGN